jgi:hypothetical protein
MSELQNKLVSIAKEIANDNDPKIKKELDIAKIFLEELKEKKANLTITKVEEQALIFLSTLINFSDINI